MFAGLAVEGSSDESSDGEPEPAAAAPPCTPVHSVLGGIDDQDLEITIETLNAVAADLTLFRSLPFKPLRQALGPLAEELLGSSGGAKQRGRGRCDESSAVVDVSDDAHASRARQKSNLHEHVLGQRDSHRGGPRFL